MEWAKKEVIYRGFAIWVGKRRQGDWLASVSALPEKGAMFVAGPGEGHTVGPFGSRKAALDAAKKHIERTHKQRRARS